jgi:hypothetical protein
MSSKQATAIDYCRAIVPLIGVGLGIYLVVVHRDQFWIGIIGSTDVTLALILLAMSLFALGFGLAPLFGLAASFVRTTYVMTTVLSFFIILVISSRISVTRQHQADFWFTNLEPQSNESRLADEFLSIYNTEDDRKAFIRRHTAIPHIVAFSLSYLWIVVITIAERRSLFELLASLHDRNSGDAKKCEEEPSADSDWTRGAAVDVEEVPIANAEDAKHSSGHGTDTEYEQPTKDIGGRRRDSSDSEVVVRIERPMPNAPRQLMGEVPATLRAMNFDPPPAPPPAAGRGREEGSRYALDDGVLSLSDQTASYDRYDYSEYSDW